MMLGVYGTFNGIFLQIRIPKLLALQNISSGEGLLIILLGEFVGGFCEWLWSIFYILGQKE